MTTERIEKLRELLPRFEVDAILLASPPNLRHCCNFTGSTALLYIDEKDAIFTTDSRYTEQANAEVDGAEVEEHASATVALRALAARTGKKKFGFEAEGFNYGEVSGFLKAINIEAAPVYGCDELRSRKTEAEIAAIKKAVEIAENAFNVLLKETEIGKSERELAALYESTCRLSGSKVDAFETIVASGPRGALPHGVASDKKIADGELVVVDFGAEFGGYFADQTCCLSIGAPDEKQKEVHAVVAGAQAKAFELIRPGAKAVDIDAAAREYIDEAGYGKYFRHGLGHGVGLLVHEAPRISPASKIILEPGMVFTVEPGIYLPNWGGVRLEDMVLVTETGFGRLTTLDKNIYVIE